MKKQILVIGDIHGNPDWKSIITHTLKNNQLISEIIFVGDYCDSFEYKAHECLYNLKCLIEFAKKQSHLKFTFLLGNHDYAYIHNFSLISGYQHHYASEYKQFFEENKDMFKLAWGYTNEKTKKYTLITHAGLTKKYWERYFVKECEDENSFIRRLYSEEELNNMSIHDILNIHIDKAQMLWKVGYERGGSNYGSILWADYKELCENPYPDINQIVGHTAKSNITIKNNTDECLIFTDLNYTTGHIVVDL